MTRLRLHGDADLALAGSKHYVAASTGTNAAYEVSQVAFINDMRNHFGQEPIQAFVDWMDGEVAVDDLWVDNRLKLPSELVLSMLSHTMVIARDSGQQHV